MLLLFSITLFETKKLTPITLTIYINYIDIVKVFYITGKSRYSLILMKLNKKKIILNVLNF